MKTKGLSTIICILFISFTSVSNAQSNALVNTNNSPFAKMTSVNMGDVAWTNGFWAERFQVCKEAMVPHMMGCYLNDTVSHAFLNFEIAAGLKNGEHVGPPFHDGDFYKMLEAEISVYGVTKDLKLKEEIDTIISIIAKAQRSDGYIHTPTSIKASQHPEQKHEFNERLDFETYNMGHLMTAACIHYRITGEKKLLNIAIKATDFLYNFYKTASAELARNAICPSHYMGVTEMYRTTGDPKYLELSKSLIEIRSMVESGSDHNQDRIPFTQQTKAVGHAVRANYLYAGVADVYTETGDDSLLSTLEKIWEDVVYRKMYITGACGALYDGVSPNGTTYSPPAIQQVHQAYGEDYQLPNVTAHNESCANIGNLLWNWRMFLITGEAKYVDVLEQVAYNSLLAGVSLDGKGYFYTNPLCVVHSGISDSLRWSREREPYISYCNCCPPNTIRTIAEMQEYAYSVSEEGIWVNLYGSSKLNTILEKGTSVQLEQKSAYPWDGKVSIEIEKTDKTAFSLFIRIPAWTNVASVKVNGVAISAEIKSGTYVEIKRIWQTNDQIEILFPMKARLIESNPLVEENRNQVAIMYGPVVYCLDGIDVPKVQSLFDISIPSNIKLKPEAMMIGESHIIALTGKADLANNASWNKQLYREVKNESKKVPIRLIPYYAWGNRGKADMSVWLPFNR
ncbi:MAG: glycoside hydrolase family 127 protein [Prolixibacteraceae bacterium]